MDAAAAKHIARAFLPERVLGNRYDYYYTLTKLRTDPLYPGVLDALRRHDAPLLDLGCGLGLLAQALVVGVEHDDDRRVVAIGDQLRRGLGDRVFSLRDHGHCVLVNRSALRLEELVEERPHLLLPFLARALQPLFGLLSIQKDEA